MKDRWLRMGGLAAGLFLINVIARAVARFGFDGDTEAQDRISLIMFSVIAVVLGTMAFRWGRARPLGEWLGEIGGAVLAACLATVLVAPLFFGGNPFGGGAGEFFAQIWLYGGFAIGGVLLGYLVLIVLGKDYRSRQLARYAESKLTKPKKPVRR